MIHAFLGFRQQKQEVDNRIPTISANVVFRGKKDGKEFWAKQMKADEKKFPKVDWLESDTEKRNKQVVDHMNAYVNWFADKEFTPAGESANERIYYIA